VTYTKGKELLKDYRLDQSPKTNRAVASCCNAVLVMRFDDARHWVPIYRSRFGPNPPPIQMRVCTIFAKNSDTIPSDVPSSAGYPAKFILKLVSSRVAMLFGS
jgi:hypothetical protein